MVDLDIIEPVDEPTDWVNGLVKSINEWWMVIVKNSNRKLWTWLDPRPLHQAFKQEHPHLSTAEELYSQMSGAKNFSRLDVISGY